LTEREALLFKNILTNEQQARLAALELVRLTLGDRPDPSELIRLASWVLSGADTTG
jgi:DNA-binding TFAR19-related protein (PDSD5 family)